MNYVLPHCEFSSVNINKNKEQLLRVLLLYIMTLLRYIWRLKMIITKAITINKQIGLVLKLEKKQQSKS